MTAPSALRPIAVGALLALVLAFLPTGTASAACDPDAPALSPVLAPDTPFEEFKVGDPARFSGSVQVDCGWSYRQFNQTTGQAFIEYLDDENALLGRSDVTQEVEVASDGTISGDSPTIFSGDRKGATRLRLFVRVTSSSGVATATSPEVAVDGVQPSITGYFLTSPNTVVVSFSEEVVVENGDRVTDWRIDDERPRAVSGSGAQRTLTLLTTRGEDATPEVFYRAFDPLDINRQEYRDGAGNRIDDQNRIAAALDRVPPSVPVIGSVDGVDADAQDPVIGTSRTPRIEVSGVTDGHRVELYRDSLTDATRVFDRPDAQGRTVDVLLATVTKQPGQPLVIEPSDYAEPLPGADTVHTFYARSLDTSDNASGDVDTVRYNPDFLAPRPLLAIADGPFVTVEFDDDVLGANRREDWALTTGGPVTEVSGSGRSRLIRGTTQASGRVSYTPNSAGDNLRDAAGNQVGAFTLDILSGRTVIATGQTSADEGKTLGFLIRLASAQDDPITASFTTQDGTALAGLDYVARTGSVTFQPGETQKLVAVTTLADELDEDDETVVLRLTGVQGGEMRSGADRATGVITDTDPLPSVAVQDIQTHEGTTARVAVRLSAVSGRAVSVRYATAPGTATSGADFTARSGTATIPAGTRQVDVVIPIAADDETEPAERFTVTLSDPVNATLGRATATVTILDGLGVSDGIARVAGASRTETSAEISEAFFDRADVVVVATADAYPDALAGAPLAAQNDAPVLLTGRSGLHPAIRSEVERLGATKAFVLGGAGALSSKVDDDLRAAGIRAVTRIAGRNRFETAQRIAARVGGTSVYLVEGNNADPARGWPDAVAVSGLAAAQQRPILLTERDRFPSETRAALRTLKPTRVDIVGGTQAVNDAVARAADAEAGTVARIAGRTRYETSLRIAEASVAAGLDAGNTWVATGDDWPDSLSASPAVARTGGILLLVDSDDLDDSPPARSWLQSRKPRSVTVVGGVKAISAAVFEEIRKAAGL